MTKKEAIQVAFAISTVDGGCSYCISDAFKILNECDIGWKFHVEGNGPEGAEIVIGESYTNVAVSCG